MEVTKILKAEHQNILNRLNLIETKFNSDDWKNLTAVKDLLLFLQEYADEFHHAKEETIYFTWMENKDPMVKQGPLHCMLGEHEQTRELVQKAIGLVEKIEAGESIYWGDLKSTIEEYIMILKNHISKEDNILYEMAESFDTGDGDEFMLPLFENVAKQFEHISKKYS